MKHLIINRQYTLSNDPTQLGQLDHSNQHPYIVNRYKDNHKNISIPNCILSSDDTEYLIILTETLLHHTTFNTKQATINAMPQHADKITDADECPICYDQLHKPVLLKCCGNLLCLSCILKCGNDTMQLACPICRRELNEINHVITDMVNNGNDVVLTSKQLWLQRIDKLTNKTSVCIVTNSNKCLDFTNYYKYITNLARVTYHDIATSSQPIPSAQVVIVLNAVSASTKTTICQQMNQDRSHVFFFHSDIKQEEMSSFDQLVYDIDDYKKAIGYQSTIPDHDSQLTARILNDIFGSNHGEVEGDGDSSSDSVDSDEGVLQTDYDFLHFAWERRPGEPLLGGFIRAVQDRTFDLTGDLNDLATWINDE
ncbi:Hypothetical protein MVR_LOCUS95 [uncultured virus]|nr:Hypothetical protein MVR_LOCUS95 [uncultured virus]